MRLYSVGKMFGYTQPAAIKVLSVMGALRALLVSASLSVVSTLTATQLAMGDAPTDKASTDKASTPADRASIAAGKASTAADKAADTAVKADAAKGQENAEQIRKQIQDLVAKDFPRAKITNEQGKLHFEYKVKKGVGFYSDKPEVAPESGGILGDVYLEKGEYGGSDKAAVGTEVANGYHTVLLMAPYSKSQDAHLVARLDFPSDVSEDFKQQFKTIVSTFNAGEVVNSPSEAEKKSASENPPAPVPIDMRERQAEQSSQKPAEKPPEKPKPPGYDAAVKLYSARKWALAQKAFEQLIKTGGGDADVHADLAYCLYNERQYSKAYREFSYAASHSPHNLSLQFNCERSADKLAREMSGICPATCLKRTDPGWGTLSGERCWIYSVPHGKAGFTEAHLGHLLVKNGDYYTDKGVCPVCGGTGRVTPLRDGDPLPQ